MRPCASSSREVEPGRCRARFAEALLNNPLCFTITAVSYKMPFTKLPDVKGVTLELRPSGILQVTMNTPKTYNSFDDQRCKLLTRDRTGTRLTVLQMR